MKVRNNRFRIYVFSLLLIFLFFSFYFLLRNHQASADKAGESVQSAVATAASTASPDIGGLNWPAGQTIDVPILMYHHVGPLPANADDVRKGLTVSAEEFEGQMKYLKDNSYKGLSFVEMYRMVAKDSPLQEKSIVLTFDDGYSDNYEVARPILEKYGFAGTFFIISGKIGQAEYMNEAQIRELAAKGNEIGSHSVSHPDLANLSGAKMKTEVEKSKTDLEKITGEKVVSFCYPAGKYNEAVEKAVQAAGYKIAVTTQKFQPFSTDKPFEVPRYRINPGTSLKSLLD